MEGLCRYLVTLAGVGCLWDECVSVGSEHWAGPAGELGTCGVGECRVCDHTSELLSLPAQEEEGMGVSVLV